MGKDIIINSGVLGLDMDTVIVNDKAYTIFPPTLGMLAKAGDALGGFGEGKTVDVVLRTASNGKDGLARALSCLVCGDESLVEELIGGTEEELVMGIEKSLAYVSMKTVANMTGIKRNITSIIARER